MCILPSTGQLRDRIRPWEGVHFGGGARLPDQCAVWHFEAQHSTDAAGNHPYNLCQHHPPGAEECDVGMELKDRKLRSLLIWQIGSLTAAPV